MPKGPTRQWRKLKEPILDDEVRASVAMGQHLIHPPGEHDLSKQFYATLIHNGCKTEADAAEISRALHRAGKRLGYSISAKVEKALLGGWQVKFKAMCKECARAYVLKTYGDDRSRWPYDPLRKRNEEDHE